MGLVDTVTVRWPLGYPKGLEQTCQRLALLAQRDEQEAARILHEAMEAERRYRDGPCHCDRLPWTPHKHSYQLTPRGLT